MPVTSLQKEPPWLLLIFSLPAAKASERVGVWRRLQRYGALALPSSGYVLPNTPANRERFEWLAASIRSTKGQAAVAQVSVFNDLRSDRIEQMFNQARSREYQALEKELKEKSSRTVVARVKRRLQQIIEIDFFGCPGRARVEAALLRLEKGDTVKPPVRLHVRDYRGRTWITRPRPGIDRVSSAWLIRRFIDKKARFIFDKDASRHPNAIPFDMFQPGGFGHQGDDCTFETLVKSFAVRDRQVALLAEAIHDADLADERFGHDEALGIDRILEGWAAQGVSDQELLQRGMEMIEGLYKAIK